MESLLNGIARIGVDGNILELGLDGLRIVLPGPDGMSEEEITPTSDCDFGMGVKG